MNSTINPLGQPVGLSLPGWTQPPLPPREPMTGRFCRLEPLQTARHAAELYRADSEDVDGRSWTYLPYGPFDNLASYAAWADSVSHSTDSYFYAIVDSKRGRAVGVACYQRIKREIGSVEVGHVHYSPQLQRTPAATEAMILMMQRVFELGYRRYEWKCDALNEASCRAARRLGFTFEGIFRQALIYKGRNRDTAWYSVLDGEWPALKKAFEQWLHPSNFDAEGKQRVRLSELTGAALVGKAE